MVALRVVPVTDEAGQIIEPALLAAAGEVHRQLRPMLPEDYPAKMARVFAGGARMVVAVHDGRVLGLGGSTSRMIFWMPAKPAARR